MSKTATGSLSRAQPMINGVKPLLRVSVVVGVTPLNDLNGICSVFQSVFEFVPVSKVHREY